MEADNQYKPEVISAPCLHIPASCGKQCLSSDYTVVMSHLLGYGRLCARPWQPLSPSAHM